ncbi:MAG: hypothetical protein H0U25_10345 [Thermoleophilaceae bacterium]|nr:hypothetical protein [Thermoleophilaceae bacterium]
MPTFEPLPRFLRDYARLTQEQKKAWVRMRRRFVAGLKAGRLDPALRVKRVQGHPGVWEISWAPDGRATFHYGDEVHPGEPHVVWRRIGTHDVLDRP